MDSVYKEALALHKTYKGKIAIRSLLKIKGKKDLSLVYTPGVAEVSRQIARDKDLSYDLTWRGRTVAVVSDGSAVLGLGNVGPEAALPVMEGKALLLKLFGGVDAVPLVIDTQSPDEIVRLVKQLAPSFAGINLEDISAPRCFQIEEELQDIGIPVFHDDQHGTAIVVAAALHNAAKVIGKTYESLEVVVVGAGAAGLSVAKMLLGLGCGGDVCRRLPGSSSVRGLIVVDRKGALYAGRSDQNVYKQAVAGMSNKEGKGGALAEVIRGADVVIGVSGPRALTKEMIRTMGKDPIVFAMANPTPEIMPDEARDAGAAIVATGRSDYPNQINNVLAFPGIFRAVVAGRLKAITPQMKLAASQRLAGLIQRPTAESIIPSPFTPNLAKHISRAVLAMKEKKVTKNS